MKKLDAKHSAMIAVIYAAAFAIYCVIVLPFFNNKNEVFWLSFGFMCGAFLVCLGITFYSMKRVDVEAIFMNIPLLSFSFFYFFAELFASLVFMLFRANASMKLTAVVQTVMLLILVIFSIMAMMGASVSSEINRHIDTNVRHIKNLAVDVKLLEEKATDPELKKALHKIEEAIRFSDPMTNATVADLDSIIEGKVKELKYQCDSGSKGTVLGICTQLTSFISERNQKLKYSK